MMKDYSGFFFIIDEENRRFAIEEKIENENFFTDAISSPDWKSKKSEIFLLSLSPNYLTHMALVRKGNRVVTGKDLIPFSNFIEFYPSIPFEYFESKIPNKLRSHFISASKGTGRRIPYLTWIALINLIKRHQPESSEAIDKLLKLRSENFNLKENEANILAQEKDAVNITLRITGLDPQIGLNWFSQGNDEPTAPFLQGLETTSIIEDRMIEHDAKVFGDWKFLHSYMVGATSFGKGDERLTIFNVNRSNIEKNLGVDLIYYFKAYSSYIIIQYKRMDIISGKAIYRPDEQHKKQIRILEQLKKKQSELFYTGLGLLENYRLNPESIYFKLCPKTIFKPTSPEMIKGMYLPLDYWKDLMESPNTIGEKGGKKITYDNVGRYINNSLFILLAQNGWIGSKELETKQLTHFIKESLNGNKSVLFANNGFSPPRNRFY